MKIDPNSYETLKQAIKSLFDKWKITPEQFAYVYKKESLSEKRFLWDIYWETKLNGTEPWYTNTHNLLDTHLTSALRKALQDLYKFKY